MAKTAVAKKSETHEAKEVVPGYEAIHGLRSSKIVDIVRRRREIDEELAVLKQEREELNDQGVKLLVRSGVKTVMVGELRITKMDGMSSSLSKTRLLELGVKQKVIDEATVRTPYTTLLVKPPKEEDDEA